LFFGNALTLHDLVYVLFGFSETHSDASVTLGYGGIINTHKAGFCDVNHVKGSL
jgi:hypothetical protein